MPFLVANCASCNHFQVLEQRASAKNPSKKFTCKVCSAKNSIRRIYAQHDKAREVRPVCQRLNMKRGEREEERRVALEKLEQLQQQEEEDDEEDLEEEEQVKSSIWDQFVDDDQQQEQEQPQDEDDEVVINGKRYSVNTMMADERKVKKTKRDIVT